MRAKIRKHIVSHVYDSQPHQTDLYSFFTLSSIRISRGEKAPTLALVSFCEADDEVCQQVILGALEAAHSRRAEIVPYCMQIDEFFYVDLFNRHIIDGVILLCPGLIPPWFDEMRHVERLLRSGIPAVLINSGLRSPPLPVFSFKDFHAAHLAAYHLLSMGHRNIGYLLPDDSEFQPEYVRAQKRLDGYLNCLEQHGLTPGRGSVLSFSRLSEELLRYNRLSEVTGLVLHSSMQAPQLFELLSRYLLHIPNDLSVIASDYAGDSATLFPALCCVRAPFFEIGESAAGYLIDMLLGHPHGLKRRQSCDVQLGGSVRGI